MNVADQLREAVRGSGYPLASIAKAIDIPVPVLWRFVAGERGLGLENVCKLAELFQMRLTKPFKPKGLEPYQKRRARGNP